MLTVLTGADIDACLHPFEALERTERAQYDLVLVDHIMPEMDGVQFTGALRARDAYRLVPIVMVFGLGGPGTSPGGAAQGSAGGVRPASQR